MRTIRNLGGGETKLSWMGRSDGVAVIHPLFMPRGQCPTGCCPFCISNRVIPFLAMVQQWSPYVGTVLGTAVRVVNPHC